MTSPHLSLVVPCYNGAEWLGGSLAELERFVLSQSAPTELVLVDDCSHAGAANLLSDFAQSRQWVTLLRNSRNRGKGYAVARGMLAARGAFRIFTDADLAYPLSQVQRLLSLLESGASVAVANRVHPESRYTMSPASFKYHATRHLMSRTLNFAVRSTIVPGVHDTQAGLKGFAAAAAQSIFPRVTIDRFGFDIEVLLTARSHGFAIAESPVEFRYEVDASTVRFGRDIVRMASDLARIAYRAGSGHYAPPRVTALRRGVPIVRPAALLDESASALSAVRQTADEPYASAFLPQRTAARPVASAR